MTERSKSESRPKAKRATIGLLLVPRHREATIRAVGNQTTRPLTLACSFCPSALSTAPRGWRAVGRRAGGSAGRAGQATVTTAPLRTRRASFPMDTGESPIMTSHYRNSR